MLLGTHSLQCESQVATRLYVLGKFLFEVFYEVFHRGRVVNPVAFPNVGGTFVIAPVIGLWSSLPLRICPFLCAGLQPLPNALPGTQVLVGEVLALPPRSWAPARV